MNVMFPSLEIRWQK